MEECQVTTSERAAEIVPTNRKKKGPKTSPQTHAIIIDFMALVSKIPLKKLVPPVKTFYDFAIALTSMVTKAGHNCDEIHIVFDHYREDSIKNSERKRRGKSKETVVLTRYHRTKMFQ